MNCTYIGKFNEEHTSIKKRRIIGSAKTAALTSILKEGLSCETFRVREAGRLMTIGTYVTLIII